METAIWCFRHVAFVLDPAFIVVFALAIVATLYLESVNSWIARSQGRPLPPGPKGLPILGNMFDMPTSRPWIGLRKLCAQHGNILGMRTLGRSIIILGSADVASEFMYQRAASTSDRIQTPSLLLTGHDWNFGLWSYGAGWRHHRRVFWHYFSPAVIPRYQPVQTKITHTFLGKLLKDPAGLVGHIQYTFGATILKIVYGLEASTDNDETLASIQEGVTGTRQVLIAGGFLVDFIPILRYWPSWLPGAGFQKRFAKWRLATQRMVDAPFDRYLRKDRNQIGQCILADILAGDGKTSGSDAELLARCVGGVIFEAGSDTTSSALQTFFLAMALYPEVQRKAQAELDSVIGPGRLPNFTDRESLVYVNAIMKEVLRWLPVFPFGLSHSTSQDQEFRGYFIPAGSILMVNVWACMHDPEAYDDPETFLPERFIRDGKLDPDVRNPDDFVWGFGRRICPGRHFASGAMFITIASVLHVFNITPPVDENGKEMEVNQTILDGPVSIPANCRCNVKVRAPWAETLIANATANT